MKKLLIICFLCMPVFLYSEDNKNELTFKLGVTPYSILNYDTEAIAKNSNQRLAGLGFMVTTEYFRKLNELFSLGIGLSQQFERTMSDNDGSLYFTSIYIAPKINIYKDVYFITQIGASFINSNQSLGGVFNFDRKRPGMYYGLGIGYTYNNFIVEFLYSINQAFYEFDIMHTDGSGEISNYIVLERKETYQTFNFNIGYKFEF